MTSYRLSPSAAEDLQSISAFLRDAAGPDIASQMLTKIREKCRFIADAPGQIGAIRHEVREGLRSFVVKPYVIFFRYSDSTVEIVRVLHERQDIGRGFDEE